MSTHIVCASINDLTNVSGFRADFDSYAKLKFLIIDEGEVNIRKRNSKIFGDTQYVFYGPAERKEWFKQRFGLNYLKFLSVIPERCHAETSFGFLVALEEEPNLVIEIDDDVLPVRGKDVVESHYRNIHDTVGVCVTSGNSWYNTLENLELSTNVLMFPRGHPYDPETRQQRYTWSDVYSRCVLNMGLWLGHPDLDAITILHHEGLNGRCKIKGTGIKREKVTCGRGTYFAVCSMNTCFVPKIIPAFYQLYMNCMGIDRFDDIWSGVFFKKIADHLGDKVSLGEPSVYHDKRPRSVFKDLKKEIDGIILNEMLWRVVDDIELHGSSYWDAYSTLIHGLENKLEQFRNILYKKFMRTQIKKMKLWLEVVDRIA